MFSRFFRSRKAEKRARLEYENVKKTGNHDVLSSTVTAYLKSLSHDPNFNPDSFDVNCSDEEKSIFIRKLLKNSPSLQHLRVPDSIDSSVPSIAHLLVSLVILKKTIDLNPSDKLDELQTSEVKSQVKAGMPGPCLVYIDAILESIQFDDTSKIILLSEVIDYIESNMNRYGYLDYVVLSFAIKNRSSLLNKLDSELTDQGVQERYDNLLQKYSPMPPMKRDGATFIDVCIMETWKKLGIGIDKSNPAPYRCDDPAPGR